MLDGLSPQQTAIGETDSAPSRHILNVQKENSGDFVNEQETDGCDVQQQEQQQRRHNGNANAGLRYEREQLNECKTKDTPLFHVGGLQSIFRQVDHPVRMREQVGVVEQQHQRNERVERYKRHDDEVEVNHLSDELLTCVWQMVVKRRCTAFRYPGRGLLQSVPRRTQDTTVSEHGRTESHQRHGAVSHGW